MQTSLRFSSEKGIKNVEKMFGRIRGISTNLVRIKLVSTNPLKF